MKYLLILLTALLFVSCGEQNNSDTRSTECGLDDGIYSAEVEYYNPVTGYMATYNLDVEVKNCKVVKINFPSGGWVDEDHITGGEININGEAIVKGERSKTYTIIL